MLKLLALLFLIITLGMAQGANAGSFEDGHDAYKRGDYATALSLLRPLATQGNADAQFVLGVMYKYGQGVVQDHKEAVKWFRLAAAQGDEFSQYNLGLMYDNGQGVVEDPKEAVKWYRLAAAQGFALAQSMLGTLYEVGRGVPQNYGRAHIWYNLSASNGDYNALKHRDRVGTKLNSSQIQQAQEMASKCQASYFKKCD